MTTGPAEGPTPGTRASYAETKMLLGDVLTVVASIFGLGVSTWALFVGSAFLFDRKSVRAQSILESGPGKTFWVGLFFTFVIGALGFRLIAVPLPLAKLLGIAVLGLLIALVAVGGAGLSRVIADRIRHEDVSVTPLPAIVRGALYIVLASAMPLVGTLAIAPFVLILCAGAGARVVLSKATEVVRHEA